VVDYSHIIVRATRLMKNPSVIDSPFGRIPEKASRWHHGRTETCGGGKFVLGGSLGVLEYLETPREPPETLFRPLQASVLPRSCLEAFVGALPEGESIIEGFYINLTALSMMRE
jgi:hypothetical protein